MKAIKVNRSKAILSRDRTRVQSTFLPCCERPALALAQTMPTQHDEALVKTARFMSGSWQLPCQACIIRGSPTIYCPDIVVCRFGQGFGQF